MGRYCYNCGKNVANEPGIEGLRGLLCFPCRYRFDEGGGERYHFDIEHYPRILSEWRAKHGGRWANRRVTDWVLTFGLFLMLVGVCDFCSYAIRSETHKSLGTMEDWWPRPVCIVLFGFVLVGAMENVLKWYPCPAPPKAPTRDRDAMKSKPALVLETNSASEIDPRHVEFSNGYPPDWAERRARCLQRDGNRCRLCGESQRLHVHHVKPVSCGGVHSLQNLVSLCKGCHMNQGYYDHKRRVEYNVEIGRYLRRGGRGSSWRKQKRV